MVAPIIVFPNYDQLESRRSAILRPLANVRVNDISEVRIAALDLRTVDLCNASRCGDCQLPGVSVVNFLQRRRDRAGRITERHQLLFAKCHCTNAFGMERRRSFGQSSRVMLVGAWAHQIFARRSVQFYKNKKAGFQPHRVRDAKWQSSHSFRRPDQDDLLCNGPAGYGTISGAKETQ